MGAKSDALMITGPGAASFWSKPEPEQIKQIQSLDPSKPINLTPDQWKGWLGAKRKDFDLIQGGTKALAKSPAQSAPASGLGRGREEPPATQKATTGKPQEDRGYAHAIERGVEAGEAGVDRLIGNTLKFGSRAAAGVARLGGDSPIGGIATGISQNLNESAQRSRADEAMTRRHLENDAVHGGAPQGWMENLLAGGSRMAVETAPYLASGGSAAAVGGISALEEADKGVVPAVAAGAVGYAGATVPKLIRRGVNKAKDLIAALAAARAVESTPPATSAPSSLFRDAIARVEQRKAPATPPLFERKTTISPPATGEKLNARVGAVKKVLETAKSVVKTPEQELAEARAENARLKAGTTPKITPVSKAVSTPPATTPKVATPAAPLQPAKPAEKTLVDQEAAARSKFEGEAPVSAPAKAEAPPVPKELEKGAESTAKRDMRGGIKKGEKIYYVGKDDDTGMHIIENDFGGESYLSQNDLDQYFAGRQAAAPKTMTAATGAESAPAKVNVEAKLPTDIAGGKPRYGYQDKKFTLDFANDIDKAAYITAMEKPSKADADYLKFVMTNTGLSEEEVREYGKSIRESIKNKAKRAGAGAMIVPDTATQRFGGGE